MALSIEYAVAMIVNRGLGRRWGQKHHGLADLGAELFEGLLKFSLLLSWIQIREHNEVS